MLKATNVGRMETLCPFFGKFSKIKQYTYSVFIWSEVSGEGGVRLWWCREGCGAVRDVGRERALGAVVWDECSGTVVWGRYIAVRWDVLCGKKELLSTGVGGNIECVQV